MTELLYDVKLHVVVQLQGAMKATFRALTDNNAPVLSPVGASHLAQRRGKVRPKSSTEV